MISIQSVGYKKIYSRSAINTVALIGNFFIKLNISHCSVWGEGGRYCEKKNERKKRDRVNDSYAVIDTEEPSCLAESKNNTRSFFSTNRCSEIASHEQTQYITATTTTTTEKWIVRDYCLLIYWKQKEISCEFFFSPYSMQFTFRNVLKDLDRITEKMCAGVAVPRILRYDYDIQRLTHSERQPMF